MKGRGFYITHQVIINVAPGTQVNVNASNAPLPQLHTLPPSDAKDPRSPRVSFSDVEVKPSGCLDCFKKKFKK